MKNLRTTVLTFLLLAAFGGSAWAQAAPMKIGTVDMRKLFDGYWKTKQAQASLDDNKAELDKEYRGMVSDFKTANDDYQKLLASASDQAVSDDERARRKQAAADKLKQLQDSQTTIDQFERSARSRLADQLQRMNSNLMKDINDQVATAAKAAGDTLVINTSSDSVVFSAGGNNDLTATVLAQLNAGAPIDMANPVVAAPSLLNTNSP